MSHRFLAPLGAIATALALALLVQMPVAAQQKPAAAKSPAPAKPAKPWVLAHTAWGDPDLTGVYTFATPTPLERPNGLANKDTLTEAELAEQTEQLAEGF